MCIRTAEAPPRIQLSRSDLLRVMGADVPDRDIEEILGALGFRPARIDANRGNTNAADAVWQCEQPSWRRDVARGIDLIEEVARHYGYDKFPPRLPPAKQPAHRLPHAVELDRLRERIIALGYQEIVEIPLVDARRDELFRAEGVAPAVIGNPLAEDASVMRSNGIVGMISALEWNLNHGQRDLRLFEIGRKYELRDGEPVETPVLTLGATGLAREKTVHENAREFAFADLKGDLDRIGELAGGFAWQSGGPGWLAGGRAAQVALGGTAGLGVAGQLARRIAEQLKAAAGYFCRRTAARPIAQGNRIRASCAALYADPAFSGRGTRLFAGAFRRDFLRASRRGDSRVWAFRNCRALRLRICFAAGRCQRENSR